MFDVRKKSIGCFKTSKDKKIWHVILGKGYLLLLIGVTYTFDMFLQKKSRGVRSKD